MKKSEDVKKRLLRWKGFDFVKTFVFGKVEIAIGPNGYAIERIRQIINITGEFDNKIISQLSLIEGVESVVDAREEENNNPNMDDIYIYRNFKDKENGSWEVLLPKIEETLKMYYVNN